ncbi:MAG: PilZ domain-containing protein [Deltaproteobacteria bacterium]
MDSGESGASNRREFQRIDVSWDVDCETEDTFLYASIRNVSALGIFVQTLEPLEVGTLVTLRFSPPGSDGSFALKGAVQWINPVRVLGNRNPGMGILFVDITLEDRERLVDAVRTIAYVHDRSN